MRDNFTKECSLLIRPHAIKLLQTLSAIAEIIIFTASSRSYADKVIECLDPERRYISYVFYRENCIRTTDGYLVKDLRIFKTRDLKDMVLVDNSAYSYCLNYENAIPIVPFYGQSKDIVLTIANL